MRSLVDSYTKAYKTLDGIVPPGAIIRSYLIEKWRKTKYWEAIEDITERFSMGETVEPYLSYGANSARQLDFLLEYCGMHHAHLSTVNGKLGKKQRTDKLLFFVVTPECHVWYLDIRDHPQKGNKTAWLVPDLIGTMLDHGLMSMLGGPMEIHGISGIEPELSTEDVVELANHDMVPIFRLDHRYVSLIGRTGGGINVSALRWANNIERARENER